LLRVARSSITSQSRAIDREAVARGAMSSVEINPEAIGIGELDAAFLGTLEWTLRF